MPEENEVIGNSFFEEEAVRYSNRYRGFTWNIYEKIYQRRRIKAVLSYSYLLGSKNILDAGCGSGDHLSAIRAINKDCKLTGFDISGSMINISNSRDIPGARFFRGSVTDIELPPSSFDIILSIGVLPYVDQVDTALREMKNVLADDGFCIVTYPYKNAVVDFLRENALGLCIRKHILKMARFQVRYDILGFRDLCEATGFSVQEERILRFSEYLFLLRKQKQLADG